MLAESNMDSLMKQFRPGVVLNDRYETVSPLNHGSFGMVIMAKDRSTGHHVAVKCFNNPSAQACPDSGFKVDDRSEELKIHSVIGNHKNIVNLLDSFSTPTHTYLVLEYCSMGDLYEAIRQDKGPKETEHVRHFMLQLVEAVECLHAKNIFHRDIKPENIFLTEKGDVKLGDFGLATTDTWSYESSVGSNRYMAPEQYNTSENGLAPAKADIWSIGICLLNILFSRNPFDFPATDDPLYADYFHDRQSLFDVFPNLSQDTFEVLINCLAIDPTKRDLSLVKEARHRVISFTTDDESLDEFCTENREVVTATANRQPLETPAISSPTIEEAKAYPWTKALHMASPPERQLPSAVDASYASEDLFPGSEASTQDWFDKADTRSFESIVDSGLGVSIGSSLHKPDVNYSRTKPMAIAGSLPVIGGRASSALASIFGRKKQLESKSWSDMIDDDDDDDDIFEEYDQRDLDVVTQARPPISSRQSKVSMLSQEDESDDGRSTPRACPAHAIRNQAPLDSAANFSKDSVPSNDDNVSAQTGFVFEDDKTPAALSQAKYSPPTKQTIGDRWLALGDKRRRANKPIATNTGLLPLTGEKSRFRSPWRRTFTRKANAAPEPAVWHDKEWNRSNNWRRSGQNLARSPLGVHPSQLDGVVDVDEGSDDGMWVGGWRDFHL